VGRGVRGDDPRHGAAVLGRDRLALFDSIDDRAGLVLQFPNAYGCVLLAAKSWLNGQGAGGRSDPWRDDESAGFLDGVPPIHPSLTPERSGLGDGIQVENF
jgi:hypothetical protein